MIFVNDIPVWFDPKKGTDSLKKMDVLLKKLERKNRTRRELVFHATALEFWRTMAKHTQLIEASGGIIFNKKNEFFMIERLGKLDLPKGKIEKNEGIEEAALREIEEECGLKKLRIVMPLSPTYHTYLTNAIRNLKKTNWFLLEQENEEPIVLQTSEGITGYSWIKNTEMNNIEAQTYPGIYLVVKEAIQNRNYFKS